MSGIKEKSGGKREGAGRKASTSSVRNGSQIRIRNTTKELLSICGRLCAICKLPPKILNNQM